MPTKRHSPEQIISNLRVAEVHLAKYIIVRHFHKCTNKLHRFQFLGVVGDTTKPRGESAVNLADAFYKLQI